MREPGYESDRMRLALYDRQSGKTSVFESGFDQMVDEMIWTEDSRGLVFHSPVEGRSPLLRRRGTQLPARRSAVQLASVDFTWWLRTRLRVRGPPRRELVTLDAAHPGNADRNTILLY